MKILYEHGTNTFWTIDKYKIIDCLALCQPNLRRGRTWTNSLKKKQNPDEDEQLREGCQGGKKEPVEGGSRRGRLKFWGGFYHLFSLTSLISMSPCQHWVDRFSSSFFNISLINTLHCFACSGDWWASWGWCGFQLRWGFCHLWPFIICSRRSRH